MRYLTETSSEGITANGINVNGSSSLTSQNSSVTLNSLAGFNNERNSISGNLTAKAKKN
jgi:hypothetical protein